MNSFNNNNNIKFNNIKINKSNNYINNYNYNFNNNLIKK
jgi:hypothetical protein